MKSVSYTSYTKLNCSCSAEVIVCLDEALTASGAPYIDATIGFADTVIDSCSKTKYRYAVTYNEGQLLDPTYSLVETDIEGIVCKGCLINYVDYKAADFTRLGFCFVSTEAELIACQSAVTTQVVVIAPFALTQDVTVIKPLFIVEGSPITCTGHVLHLVCNHTSGLYQCFIAAAGEVDFGNGVVGFGTTTRIYFEWFGAVGNGIIDDTAALQTAIVAQYPSFIPIYACPRKTYMLSTITLFDRTTIKSEAIGLASPTFKSNLAVSMVIFPAGPLESFIELQNLVFDGNNLALSLVVTNFNQSIYIHDCWFKRANVGIDMSLGGYWCTYERNIFTNCNTGILLGASCPDLKIYQNNIKDSTFGIYAPNTFRGTYTEIISNSIGRSTPAFFPIDFIRIETDPAHNNNYTVIRQNAFEGEVTGAFIYLGQEVHGVVADNVFNGNAGQGLNISGAKIQVEQNSWIFNILGMGAVGHIVLSGFSSDCVIYPQDVNSGSTYTVYDVGTNNRFMVPVLKGNTAGRPAMASGANLYVGHMYMDTDLDADGLPIWWNGVKWIKADGSDA